MVTRVERSESFGEHVVARLESDLRAALRRKPAHENQLAGALRTLCPHSDRLRAALFAAFEVMVRRGSFGRPLYGALARALAESGDQRGSAFFKKALEVDEPGTFATISAVGLSSDPALTAPLARLAGSRHAHIAFAAEIARIARGESAGTQIASLAPRIKESHRIALCAELFVPLTWHTPLAPTVGAALAVLREDERHLGRWLVFAEVAVRAGDGTAIAQARERARLGPESARPAWSLVAWALSANEPPPDVRPTAELLARLSDRPSADRDTTFLFRMAHRRASAARPMLETLAKSSLASEAGLRAALHLARDFGEARWLESLAACAQNARREGLRGLAAAALFDAGDRERATRVASELLSSRQVSTLAWGALLGIPGRKDGEVFVSESRLRRLQFGWVE
jgi:hypothetical protein